MSFVGVYTAFKYKITTGTGKFVCHCGNKLTLRITENESQAQIAVTDNGIGISPSNLPHIFERMYQCDDSRLADGNGLGLAIVKELVIAHKGEIKVESIPSVGTTFIIMFRKVL